MKNDIIPRKTRSNILKQTSRLYRDNEVFFSWAFPSIDVIKSDSSEDIEGMYYLAVFMNVTYYYAHKDASQDNTVYIAS